MSFVHIRNIALGLLLSTPIFAANSPSPVYPLEPPGHGPNGDWAFVGRYRNANASLKSDDARRRRLRFMRRWRGNSKHRIFHRPKALVIDWPHCRGPRLVGDSQVGAICEGEGSYFGF